MANTYTMDESGYLKLHVALEPDIRSDLLLRLVTIDEEYGVSNYLKIYSNCDSLETCKNNNDQTPIYIEIANSDEYVNDGEGFGLSIEQTKELIKVLQQSIEYLES